MLFSFSTPNFEFPINNKNKIKLFRVVCLVTDRLLLCFASLRLQAHTDHCVLSVLLTDWLGEGLIDTYPEQLDLPRGNLLHCLVTVRIHELLDGNKAAGVSMAALQHSAITALPDQTQRLIAFH